MFARADSHVVGRYWMLADPMKRFTFWPTFSDQVNAGVHAR